MDDLSLTESFEQLHKKLYHTINQYGTACLLGDKEGARRLLEEIKNIMTGLAVLTSKIDRLENAAYETQSIIGVVEEDNLE